MNQAEAFSERGLEVMFGNWWEQCQCKLCWGKLTVPK
jgi:hypothetical protein